MARRLLSSTGAAVTVFLLLAGGAGTVRGDEATAQAKAHYETGKAHFDANRFEEAMADFTEAYNLTAEPNLLFNLAACAERMGEKERAIAYYNLYLDEVPDAPDADVVRGRIEALESGETPNAAPPAEGPVETPEETTPADEPPPPPPPPVEEADPATYYDLSPEDEPAKKPLWPKLTIALGGAVTAGGITTAILAYNGYKGLKTSCKPNCTDDEISSSKALAITSDVLLITGTLTLAAGIVSLVLTNNKFEEQQKRTVRLRPAGGPGSVGMGVEGRF